MASLAKLVAMLTLDSGNFTNGLDNAQKALGGFGGAAKGVGSIIGGLAAAKGIADLTEGVLKIGSDWDSVMDGIQTKTGATGDTLDALGGVAKDVFTSIPTTMDTAGDAVASLNQKTGDTGKTLENLSKTEIELARITGSDLNAQIDSSTKAFKVWGLAGADQTKTLDQVYAASQKTGIGTTQLTDELAKYGPTFKQMGFGANDAIGFLAKMDQQGVNTGTVMAGMKKSLNYFNKAGVSDVHAGLTDVFNSIKNASSAAEAGTIATKVFGAKAGPELAQDILSGKLSVEDLNAALGDNTTSILDTASATNDFGEKFQVLKNKVIAAAIPLGGQLFDAVNALMPEIEFGVGLLASFVGIIANMPAPVLAVVAALLSMVAVAGPIMSGYAKVKDSVMSIIEVFAAEGAAAEGAAAAEETAAVASGTAWTAMLGPLLIVIAVIAAFALAYKTNFLGFGDLVRKVVGGAVSLFARLWGAIQTLTHVMVLAFQGGKSFTDLLTRVPKPLQPLALGLIKVAAAIGDLVRAFQNGGIQGFLEQLPKSLGLMERGLALLGSVIGSFIADSLGKLVDAFAGLLDKIGLGDFGAALQTEFAAAVKVVNDAIALVKALVSGDWATAWADLKTLAVDGVQLAIDEIKTRIALIKDVFGAIPWDDIGAALLAGVGKLGDLGAALLSWVADAIAGIDWGAVASGAYDVAGDIVGKLGDLSGDVLAWVRNAVSNLPWSHILNDVEDVAGSIVEKLGDLGGDVLAWVRNALSNLPWSHILNDVLDVAGQIVGKMGDLSGAVLIWVRTAVSNLPWSHILSDVADVAAAIVGKMGDLSTAVLTWVRNATSNLPWSHVLGDVVDVAAQVVAKLGDLSGAVLTWVRNATGNLPWSHVLSGITDVTGDVVKGLGDLGKAISDWVSDAAGSVSWGTVFSDAETALSSVSSAISAVSGAASIVATAIGPYITTITNALKGIWDAVSPAFTSIGTGIGGLLSATTAVSGVIETYTGKISGALSAIWDVVSPVFTKITGSDGIGSILGAAITVSDTISEYTGKIAGFISGIWDVVSGPLGHVKDLLNDISGVAKTVGDALGHIPGFGGGGDAPHVNNPNAGSRQTDPNNPPAPTVTLPAVPTIDPNAGNVASGIVAAIQTAQAAIATSVLAISQSFADLVASATTAFTQLSGIATAMGVSFNTNIYVGLLAAQVTAENVWIQMETDAGAFVPAFAAFATAAGNDFNTAIYPGLLAAQVTAENVWTQMEGDAGGFVGAFSPFATAAGSNFNQNLYVGLAAAQTTAENVWTQMENDAGGFAGELGAFGTSAGNSFNTNLGTGLSSAVSAAVVAAGAIEGALDIGDQWSNGDSIGNSLGQGINDGIAAWTSTIAATAASAVSGAVAAAKAAGGIRSPSREMMFVGDMLGKGAHLAMSKWIRPMADVAGDLVNAAIPSVSGGGAGLRMGGDGLAGVSGGGDSYSISITIGDIHNGDKKDADQLAQELTNKVMAAFAREGRLRRGGR